MSLDYRTDSIILRLRKWAASRQTQTSLVCSRLAPLLRKLKIFASRVQCQTCLSIAKAQQDLSKPRDYGVKF